MRPGTCSLEVSGLSWGSFCSRRVCGHCLPGPSGGRRHPRWKVPEPRLQRCWFSPGRHEPQGFQLLNASCSPGYSERCFNLQTLPVFLTSRLPVVSMPPGPTGGEEHAGGTVGQGRTGGPPSSKSAHPCPPCSGLARPCGQVPTPPSRAWPIVDGTWPWEAAVLGWKAHVPTRGLGTWGPSLWLDSPVRSRACPPFWWATAQLGGLRLWAQGAFSAPHGRLLVNGRRQSRREVRLIEKFL